LRSETSQPHTAPVIVPRSEHNISRAQISDNALKVLYRLKNAGYAAYLVGGGVRDLLLGREPKDFDVATDARPEDMRKIFSNSRMIGRRFKLVHVHFGRDVVEVATFRAAHDGDAESNTDSDAHSEDGMILRDNVYGDIEQDAWRRDFTVNSLYYNIEDFSVVDYVATGMSDLKAGVLRLIGEPAVRYREDPVRMLRAVRFAAKLGFRIHSDTEAPMRELGERLRAIPPARLFEEVLKLFCSGFGVASYELLRHYDLFKYVFPQTDSSLAREENNFPHTLVLKGLGNTDDRIAEGKPVTPAFLFAVMLWDPMRELAATYQQQGMSEIQALQAASMEVMRLQAQSVALPKRIALQVREIWTLQPRLTQRSGKRAQRLLEQPRFRAGYDFMLLRAAAGEPDLQELCTWWTEFQAADETLQNSLLSGVKSGDRPRRRRPRRRPTASKPS
jgi:poly(A) polymerase